MPVALDQLPLLTRTSAPAIPLTGEPGSLAVPEMVVGELVRFAPLAGLEIERLGGVTSMLMVSVTGPDVETFPAAS